ncbi:transposable element tc1 transposase [Lasius niger]|uniref:Transposable element tc1 transposase n=1 Tax=Lasius niger TaxID=67767 RepID=A0A0J7KN55_LASNI|nr:transposable element tc1 transposase [Lasius niger]
MHALIRTGQWNNVLFTDESRFCLLSSDRRVHVWRRQGHRFEQNCVEPVRAFGGGSIMVWSGISTHERTNLVTLPPPRMTAVRYVEEVLRLHVIPMHRRMGRNFILMQDNARPHNARIALNFFEENNIEVIPHPPMSRDLNPIKHVWDIMERRLHNFKRPPTILQ